MKPSRQAPPETACPIGPVVDIVFSRWTTPILWALHEFGRQRFVELERRIGTITPKVLTSGCAGSNATDWSPAPTTPRSHPGSSTRSASSA